MDLDLLVGKQDNDAAWFMQHFQEKPPGFVFEVGAQEELLAYILSRKGFDVYGADFRWPMFDYDALDAAFDVPCLGKYTHLVGNFMTIETNIAFDVVIAISTIEHFGLGTYGEEDVDMLSDLKAIQLIYSMLKPGGAFYVTVPFGEKAILGRMEEIYHESHYRKGERSTRAKEDCWEWRVYDKKALETRIIQNFRVDSIEYFFSGSYEGFDKGQIVSEEIASKVNKSANCSVGLRLIK